MKFNNILRHPFFKPILFVCFVSLLALTAGIYNMLNIQNKSFANRLENVIPEFQVDAVQKIEISSALDNRKVTVFFDGSAWKVAERDNAQADTLMIANFLQELSKVKPLKELDYSHDDKTLRDLNLADKIETDPETGKKNTPGIRLVLYGKDNNMLLDMMLGRGHIRPLENQMDKPQLDGRYIAIKKEDGSTPVFLISNTLQDCIPIPGIWLEKLRILNAQQLFHITYRKLKTADQEQQVLWRILVDREKGEPLLLYPPDKKLSQQELSKTIQTLMQPMSLDIVLNKKADEIAFTDLLQLTLNNGYNYNLKLSKDEKNRMFAVMDVSFFPEHVVRSYGETDEQFAQRKDMLTQRFEFEKNAYQNRVFLVRNDLIDLLSAVPES